MRQNRYISNYIQKDVLAHHKMAFVSGPRQVGKTTLAKSMLTTPTNYYTWDDETFRKAWSKSPLEAVSSRGDGPIVLDEIHKDRQWKGRIKGLFDMRGEELPIIVTGSARLDIFRRGGDSLMGRYIPYRLHPLTVAETEHPVGPDDIFEDRAPQNRWSDLLSLGGFPEPFFGGSLAKAKRWSRLRLERLIQEDVRDLRAVRDLQALRVIVDLLPERVGSPLSINGLREDAGVAYASAYEWLQMLEQLYHCLTIKPYAGKLSRTLKSEAKLYLFDIMAVKDPAARLENLAALHLLKACQFWTDSAQGDFELRYLRDKEKREVDFCILNDGKPWMLVECKTSETTIAPSLGYFAERLKTKHNFQLVSLPVHPAYIREHKESGIVVMDYERFFARIL